MKGGTSLETRMEALSILSCVAQELSGMRREPHIKAISNYCNQLVVRCSTRLQHKLGLHDNSKEEGSMAALATQSSKTKR